MKRVEHMADRLSSVKENIVGIDIVDGKPKIKWAIGKGNGMFFNKNNVSVDKGTEIFEPVSSPSTQTLTAEEIYVFPPPPPRTQKAKQLSPAGKAERERASKAGTLTAEGPVKMGIVFGQNVDAEKRGIESKKPSTEKQSKKKSPRKKKKSPKKKKPTKKPRRRRRTGKRK